MLYEALSIHMYCTTLQWPLPRETSERIVILDGVVVLPLD